MPMTPEPDAPIQRLTHMQTPATTNNLTKLAAYLDTLPENYTQFNMSDYARTNNPEDEFIPLDTYSPECGAICCAVGHGPAAGIPPLDVDMHWDGYCLRVFGVDNGSDQGWDWMFAISWAGHDNTPQGAAKRIRYYLAHGVPKVFTDDGYKASLHVYQ